MRGDQQILLTRDQSGTAPLGKWQETELSRKMESPGLKLPPEKKFRCGSLPSEPP